MSIKRIEVGPRMSQAVVSGNLVFVAGQVGTAGDDVTAQTKTVLANIDRLLAAAGTDKSHIVNAMVWLADMGNFGAMNKVWESWVDPANTPARATGEVKLAAPEFHVEIIVVAALP